MIYNSTGCRSCGNSALHIFFETLPYTIICRSIISIECLSLHIELMRLFGRERYSQSICRRFFVQLQTFHWRKEEGQSRRVFSRKSFLQYHQGPPSNAGEIRWRGLLFFVCCLIKNASSTYFHFLKSFSSQSSSFQTSKSSPVSMIYLTVLRTLLS